MDAEREPVTLEQLQAEAQRAREADAGVCDHFEAMDVTSLPDGFEAHGPLCGCSSAAGWIATNQLCRHCGRHPEEHP